MRNIVNWQIWLHKHEGIKIETLGNSEDGYYQGSQILTVEQVRLAIKVAKPTSSIGVNL